MIIVKSNLVGFGSVSGDPISSIIEPALSLQLPSIYAGDQFSIDLIFTHQYRATPTLEIGPSTSVAVVSKPEAETVTILGANSVRISSNNSNVFTDEYFQFLDNNKFLVMIPPTIDEYYSLIRYKMPNPTFKNVTRTLRLVFPANVPSGLPGFTEDVIITQSVHWRYQTAVSDVTRLVSSGAV